MTQMTSIAQISRKLPAKERIRSRVAVLVRERAWEGYYWQTTSHTFEPFPSKLSWNYLSVLGCASHRALLPRPLGLSQVLPISDFLP